MNTFKRLLAVVAVLMLFSLPAYAQYSTFIVDDDGNPLTTYPTLAAAIATASTFAGGPHVIIVEPGTYSDADLGAWPLDKIGEIKGDAAFAAADIMFVSPAGVHNFITLPGLTVGGFKLNHMTIKGYTNIGVYLNGTDLAVLDELMIEGCGTGVYANGGDLWNTVQNSTFHNNTGYGVFLDGGGPKGSVVTLNCFIGNNGGGALAQGADNNDGSDVWSFNFFDNQVFLMAGTAGEVDASTPFKVSAVSVASSYNLGDTVSMDFMWDMPACGNLDSLTVFAFNFKVNFDATKLQLIPGSALQDPTFFGPPPAIYPTPDVGTAGQIVFGAAGDLANPHMFGGRMASAKFKVIAANTSDNVYMTEIDVRDPANNPIGASSGSNTLTLVDNMNPVLVSVTANNPAGDNTYSDGSPAGGNLKLMLTLSSTDNWDLDQYQYRPDSGAWANWVTVAGPHPDAADVSGPLWYDFVWLGQAPGRHIAEIRVRDMSGKFSNVIKVVYFIDYTPPAAPAIAISDNTGCSLAPTRFTNDSLVKVTITPGDATADSMMFSESGVTTKVKYQAVSTFNLRPGLYINPHTVWVRLYDKYNNMVDWTPSNTITVDQVAPATVGPLAINLGALKTNSKNVTWTIADFGMGGYNGQYNISEDSIQMKSCTSPNWKGITLANLTPWPAAFTLSGGNGLKKVYLVSRDTAANVSTPRLMGSITYDSIAPVLTSYDLDNLSGGSCTPTGSVRARYAWTGADAATLEYSDDGGTTWGAWKAQTGIASPDSAFGGVAATPGWHVRWIRLVDDIGNIGNGMKDSVFFDAVAPAYTTIACVDAAATATPDPVYPGATNSKTFNINMTGVSGDVSKVEVSTGGPYYNQAFTLAAGALTVSYQDTAAVLICQWNNLNVRLSDCAGNIVVAPTSFYYDATIPYAVTVTGPALTNVLANVLTIAASDTCGMYQYRMADGPTTSLPWVAWTPGPSITPTVTLNASPQGNHTVNVDVSDYGGNIISKSIVIKLDNVAPGAGTVTLTSGNPLAAPGWTDSQTGNKATTISYAPDTKSMWIQNISAPLLATGWMTPPPAAPYTLNSPIVGGTNGELDTVQYWFVDSAGNQGGPFNATIRVQVSAPTAPSLATGTPGGDPSGTPKHFTKLEWNKGPANNPGQKWRIKENFQNQYPIYPDPIPPHPANFTEGIFVAEPTDSFHLFDNPAPDIYSFSIWTLGKNGMWSAELAPNIQVEATNYILGDVIDPANDGCVKFSTEFGLIGSAYSSVFGDLNFNDVLDVAPTVGGDPLGIPIPDQAVDFDDLVVLAINYGNHFCTGSLAPSQDNGAVNLAKVIARALEVSATVPASVRAGEEISVPVTITNREAVRGYHVVLDYDHANFDLVRVEQGNGYKAVNESFFYADAKTNRIDVSGVVLGNRVTFTDDEIFRVVLKAKTNSTVDLKSVELSFRDNDNKGIQASMVLSKTSVLPTEFALSQNYPNPFNPTTSIEFALPIASTYRLVILNVLGQVVKTFEGQSEAGMVTVTWDASTSGSGVYFYRLEAGSYEATRKMVLIK